MKSINFRAWDKHEATMRKVLNLFANGHIYVDCQCSPFDRLKFHSDKSHQNLSHHISDKDCVIMQSTGLNDKNSKDIYEGDIVRFVYNSTPQTERIGVTAWSDDCLAWTFDGLLIEPTPRKTIEVIGNIYQNPELLTRTQPS